MGKVYLVGAGPGAPDLITVRGANLLRRADIVFYDALVHPETVALAVDAEKIAVGKRCGRHSTVQRFINKRLIDAAARYELIVRLKGGDPMLFGRAQEELNALKEAGIAYEVVPGVTAALAASAEMGISLTLRGVSRSVVFVTPRQAAAERSTDTAWARSAAAADTVVLYMAAGQANEVAVALAAAGMDSAMPLAVIEGATLANARRFRGQLRDLAELKTRKLDGPAVILIGKVFADVSDAELLQAASEVSSTQAASI